MPQPPALSNSASAGWSRLIERLRQATAGRFTIVRELGRGGFAAVFLAQQHQPSRRVAIKLLSPAQAESQWALEHFRGESQKIAEWRHQSVVTVYEVHETDDLFYFVMSYVEGASLHEIVQSVGPLSIPVTGSILAEVGSALHYAHRQGVTHRDVKPHNILIDVDGGAVVADFGIAKHADGPSYTATGMIFGTAPYMAPEQCESGRTTSASDQYSLGIVAYEMLTGAPPFTGVPTSVLIAHISRPVPPLLDRRPDCPPELAAVVHRMLAKDPAERFPSVAEAVAAMGARELPHTHPARVALASVARRLSARSQPPVLEIQAIPSDVEVGDEIPLLAAAHTVDGEPWPDLPVEWSVEHGDVARVDEERGVLCALQPGVTTLTARAGGVEEEVRIEVCAPRAGSLQLSGMPNIVHVGDTIRLVGRTFSRRGIPVPSTTQWSSDDPAVAQVRADGEVRALAAGSTRVRATAGGISAEIPLIVRPVPVAAVQITGTPPTLQTGRHAPLAARVTDAAGTELAGRRLQWTTSDPQLATVTDAGLLTALAPGRVTIAVACEGERDEATIELYEPPVIMAPPVVVAPPVIVALPAVATPPPVPSHSAVPAADAAPSPPAPAARQETLPTPREPEPEPTPREPVDRPPEPVGAAPGTRRSWRGAGVLLGAVLVTTALFAVTRGGDEPEPVAADSPAAALPAGDDPVAADLPGPPVAPPALPPVDTPESTSVRVTLPGSVTTLSLSPPSVELRVGDAVTLDASVGTPRGGAPAAVAWRSTNSRVVAVSADGRLSALDTGSARIVAAAGGAADTTRVTVRPAAPQVATRPPDRDPAPTAREPAPPAGGAGTAGAPATDPTPPPPAAPTARQLVAQVVAGYGSAIEARRVGDLVQLYPSMSGTERQGWEAFFGQARDLEVSMQVGAVTTSGTGATARVSGIYTYTNADTRRPCRQPVEMEMTFAETPAGWRIARIVQLRTGRGEGC